MAFDACIIKCIVDEIDSFGIMKVEKIYQPASDEIIFFLHCARENLKLRINVGTSCQGINFTTLQYENPANAPMFCMLLRKHLGNSRITKVTQLDFERVIEFEFEGNDEMGYATKKYLICEIMGRYGNIILLDPSRKIISAVHFVDFSSNLQRQILPGLQYEMPQKQDKIVTINVAREDIEKEFEKSNKDKRIDRFITDTFSGIAISTARQISFDLTNNIDALICDTTKESFSRAFGHFVESLNEKSLKPYIVLSKDGKAVDYSYLPLSYYGKEYIVKEMESFSSLIDTFFGEKNKYEKIRQKSSDILRILTNAKNRLQKKISIQTEELNDCSKGEEYKLKADLITSNMYAIKKGDKVVKVLNYYDENVPTIEIQLDSRLTPSQNAQYYYKKYNKSKNAKIEITKQLALAKEDLEYIESVLESLGKADKEIDLAEIREELFQSGFASKSKTQQLKKSHIPSPLKFVTTNGYEVLCGKNNKQNDYITTKIASKGDWWFHVKNMPGSHVLLKSSGNEPSEVDFTEAASIAALYSKSSGNNIPVDYTQVKYIKKPASSKPGFVTYTVNWTAYVTPDENQIKKMLKE